MNNNWKINVIAIKPSTVITEIQIFKAINLYMNRIAAVSLTRKKALPYFICMYNTPNYSIYFNIVINIFSSFRI